MLIVRSLAHRTLPLLLASALLAICAVNAAAQSQAQSQYPALPTEFPVHFTPPTPKDRKSTRLNSSHH